MVEVIGAWRADEVASSDPETAEVLKRIRALDIVGALEVTRSLEPSKRQDYLLRLASDLLALRDGAGHEEPP